MIQKAKEQYEKVRKDLLEHVLTETPLSEEVLGLYEDAKLNWMLHDLEEVGGVALKSLQLEPTVRNMVMLLTSKMPDFNNLDLDTKPDPSIIAIHQAVLLPETVDQKVHVSEDNNLALLRIKPTHIMVYRNVADGLKEEWLIKIPETEK